MRKYLELFKDGFDSTIAEKTKVENWPYVGYSPSEGIAFTVIPQPVVYGPYVTFTADEDNSSIGLYKLSTNQTLEYSMDTTTWSTFDTTTNISLNNGDKVYVRGILSTNNTSSNYTQFKMSGKIAASGNCNAIWNYQDLNAPLKQYCGYYMFYGCTSLTAAPELPAKVIPSYAYCYMFVAAPLKKCTVDAEQIIGDYACQGMFSYCDAFTELPTFPKLRYVEGRNVFYSAFSRLPFSRIDLNEMFPSLTTEGVANSS